ncbi:hypothetical protein Plhal304r1_c003g0012271 [Plasmopara halstedii]
MSSANPTRTSIGYGDVTSECVLLQRAALELPSFQLLVGCLLFIAQYTRPDIAFAAHNACDRLLHRAYEAGI